jgi:hypothetical protein
MKPTINAPSHPPQIEPWRNVHPAIPEESVNTNAGLKALGNFVKSVIGAPEGPAYPL